MSLQNLGWRRFSVKIENQNAQLDNSHLHLDLHSLCSLNVRALVSLQLFAATLSRVHLLGTFNFMHIIYVYRMWL